MDHHLRRGLIPVLLGAALAGCAAPPPSASLGTAPTDPPTPGDAVELVLRTTPPDPPGQVGCPTALLAGVTLDVDPTRRDPILAVAEDGTRIPLVFRSGTRAAWSPATGSVAIVMPDGSIIERAGEQVSFGGGQSLPNDGDAFFACSLG